MGKVVVIDYCMGNTDSVLRAIEKCGGEPILTNAASDFETASHMILPGVGSFQQGMEHIDALGIRSKLEEQVFGHNIPFLGICLGMQLLASKGFENGENSGLGWIDGCVEKFEKTENDQKIPHIGWNEVHFEKKTSIFEGLQSGKDFYFLSPFLPVQQKYLHSFAHLHSC